MKVTLVSIAMFLALVGCVNMPATAIENNSAEPEYQQVYRFAYMALQENNWPLYKKLLRKVIDTSTSAGAPPNERAIFWYEYGRALGITCEWKQAEFALAVAHNLDLRTGGPVHKSLNELGRVNGLIKQYGKAVGYFTRGAKALAQYQEQYPTAEINLAGSAQVLTDFAYALEQTGGQPSDIQRLRDGAVAVRKKSVEKGEAYADVTPYGTQCAAR